MSLEILGTRIDVAITPAKSKQITRLYHQQTMNVDNGRRKIGPYASHLEHFGFVVNTKCCARKSASVQVTIASKEKI
jgi:hypothetical protein